MEKARPLRERGDGSLPPSNRLPPPPPQRASLDRERRTQVSTPGNHTFCVLFQGPPPHPLGISFPPSWVAHKVLWHNTEVAKKKVSKNRERGGGREDSKQGLQVCRVTSRARLTDAHDLRRRKRGCLPSPSPHECPSLPPAPPNLLLPHGSGAAAIGVAPVKACWKGGERVRGSLLPCRFPHQSRPAQGGFGLCRSSSSPQAGRGCLASPRGKCTLHELRGFQVL